MITQLFSLPCERQVLSGIIKFPSLFAEFELLLSDKEFYSKTHKIIFSLLKTLISSNIKFDKIILAQKLRDVGCHNNEEIDIFSYIDALANSQIQKNAIKENVKELLGLRIRREICVSVDEIKKFVNSTLDKPVTNVIEECDKIYNKNINNYVTENDTEDLCATLGDYIEELGSKPINDKNFLFGPLEYLNRQFGSLLRPGNITVVAAKSGVSKTSLGIFYLAHVAERYNLPILHLDNGELNKDEIRLRLACLFTRGKIPYYLYESGLWRNSPEAMKIVREELPRAKKIKFYYEQIGSKSPLEICNTIRRVAYNKIGRGQLFLTHLDYLKSLNSSIHSTPDWLAVGQLVQDLKLLYQNELNCPLWTSLQVNKLGTTTNKMSYQVEDSENSLSVSDKVNQQASHTFILRNKTMDEVAEQSNKYGNLKLIRIKARHLGEEWDRALTPVQVGKGKFENNYYNLQSKSFWFEEKADLVDIIKDINGAVNLSQNPTDSDGTIV